MILSSKVTIINNIIKALNIRKGITLDIPKVILALLDNS